ncbi:sialidase family protein [Pseudoduganella violaceinigra]|uniref:sialidase family protein n=1 Tax=Pseudoduganella violaceinigra TaxID=246602 RepID=UPI0004154003|nr:YCF48-related protein [Pseudoduganella violaceinigra]
MRQIFFRVLLSAVALTLTACAGPGQVVDPRTSNFPANNGLALVRVVTNTPTISSQLGLANQWANLYVRDSNGTQFQLLLSASEGRRSTQVFSGFLPEGKYELEELFFAIKRADLGRQGLAFQVKAGQVTNLGSIIYQSTGNNGYAVIRSGKDDGLTSMLAEEFPLLSKESQTNQISFEGSALGKENALGSTSLHVASNSPLVSGVGSATTGIMQAIADNLSATQALDTWKTTSDPVARLNLAKASTYALNSVRELPGGELIAASNLGQLLLREPSGKWLHINVGDARELTAVHARDRKNIFVGGEEGQLYMTADGGTSWQRMPFPIRASLILNIQEHLGELLVLSLEKNEFVLRSTRDPASGSWAELKRFAVNNPQLFTVHASVQNVATIHGNKYIVVVPDQALQILDLSARTWQTVVTGGWYRDVKAVDNQILLASGGHRITPFTSTDFGSTWKEVPGSCAGLYSRVVSIDFINPQDGYMLCAANGMMAGSTNLKKSSDGGASWQTVVKETPVMASQMLATKQFILYVDIINRIYVSKDGGASWTQEHVAN